ncbi:MAG: bacterial regulatory s, gntR family protein [Ramlibacter sp.]|nr:bacterial regulatory s, gntR family protein [Ramlibacter sp.]
METLMDADWKPSAPLARGNAVGQILDDLRNQILTGRIARGTKLPSEKQLADAYGVSGATVREALRGLTTSELVEVRHGSGTYVTAQADRLLDASLQAVIQIERMGVGEVLDVLGVLNAHAAERAASSATEQQVDELEKALVTLDQVPAGQDVTEELIRFLGCLARASGNPLLAALCGFLAGLQVRLARDRSGGMLEKKIAGRLSKERWRVVQAIRARNPGEAWKAARAYHERSAKVVLSLPGIAGS